MVERSDRGMFGSLVVFPGGASDEGESDPRLTGLRELHEETGLDIDRVDSLVLISRWVTPAIAPKRFDTMFYLLEVPPDVDAVVDGVELVGHAWVTPEEALGLAEAGTWAMILPTLSHLRWLARRSSIADAVSSASGTTGETVIEPTRLQDGTLLPIHRPVADR